jgi:hypothetical protein
MRHDDAARRKGDLHNLKRIPPTGKDPDTFVRDVSRRPPRPRPQRNPRSTDGDGKNGGTA